MQMSQAFCVLLSQLLFLAGADARDDMVGIYITELTEENRSEAHFWRGLVGRLRRKK